MAATFVLIDIYIYISIYIKGVPKLTQGLRIKYKINVRPQLGQTVLFSALPII